MEKIEKALDDIAIIKNVIERTQNDFSAISLFFVYIGVINLLQHLTEQLAYYFRNVNTNISEINILVIRTSQVLPIIIILLVTGILTQKKIITIATCIYSLAYIILFAEMKELKCKTLFGYDTMVSVSSISIRIVMTVGMILLGLFLKKGARSNGNKFNTRSVSNKA